MEAASWRALTRAGGFGRLLVFCGGIWLFASDGLMLATLLPGIVSDIGGAQLVGWAGALFQAASIVAGALTAYSIRRFGMRGAFCAATAGFIIGCAISALAPNMEVLQVGRFFQAFCGGALVTLAHVGAAQLFTPGLTTRALATISLVWGSAAFSAPLVGAIFVTLGSWRMAFWFAGAVALVIGAVAFVGFRDYERVARDADEPPENLPVVRLVVLMAAVLSVASASLADSALSGLALVGLGAGLAALFIFMDRRAGEKRLLPAGGAAAARSTYALAFVFFGGAGTVVMGVFGPLLLAAVFHLPALEIGYVLFSAALGWTIIATITASARLEQEPWIIAAGAFVIALSPIVIMLGFMARNVPLIALGVSFDGLGFGSCWALVIRRGVAAAPPLERDRIASAIPTLERAGLAFGAAFLSIVANVSGFSDVMSAATAQTIVWRIMALSALFAAAGLVSALLFVRPPRLAAPASAEF